jgi:hypothetical protein
MVGICRNPEDVINCSFSTSSEGKNGDARYLRSIVSRGCSLHCFARCSLHCFARCSLHCFARCCSRPPQAHRPPTMANPGHPCQFEFCTNTCEQPALRGVAWRGVTWRGVAWRGVAWRGVAWRGVAWRGVAWRGVARHPSRACRYRNVSALRYHENTHTGARPYPCTVVGCPFATTSPQGLKLHLKRHARTKPHKCALCKYSCLQVISHPTST